MRHLGICQHLRIKYRKRIEAFLVSNTPELHNYLKCLAYDSNPAQFANDLKEWRNATSRLGCMPQITNRGKDK